MPAASPRCRLPPTQQHPRRAPTSHASAAASSGTLPRLALRNRPPPELQSPQLQHHLHRHRRPFVPPSDIPRLSRPPHPGRQVDSDRRGNPLTRSTHSAPLPPHHHTFASHSHRAASANAPIAATHTFAQRANGLATGPHIAPPGISQPYQAVPSPVNVQGLAHILRSHPDQALVGFLLQGFSEGFSLGVHGHISQVLATNLRSALDNPEATSAAIQKEVDRGHTLGPFVHPPFDPCHTSPIGIVDKRDGSHRLILDLSSNHAGSVNEGISLEEFSVSYCSFDDAVTLVLGAGPTPFMAKVDIKHAFRLCPVRPAEWALLCYTWAGQYYCDTRLPFGLRSSPFIFELLR